MDKQVQISKEQEKQHLYNAIAYMTKASEELQQINGLYSFSILAQANILLSHLKYLETGNFDEAYSLNNQAITSEIQVPLNIKNEVDDLANEFKDSLELDI